MKRSRIEGQHGSSSTARNCGIIESKEEFRHDLDHALQNAPTSINKEAIFIQFFEDHILNMLALKSIEEWREHWEIYIQLMVTAMEGKLISNKVMDFVVEECHKAVEDREEKKELWTIMANQMQQRRFLEPYLASIKRTLSILYKEEGRWEDAASALVDVPLESEVRALSMDYKVKNYLEIVECFLQAKDIASAEIYLNRIVMLNLDQCEISLQQSYKAIQAQVWDYKGKFIEASQKYLEVSFYQNNKNQENSFESAVICAIVASPGVLRSRMLTTLYKDERSNRLSIYNVLQQMYLDQIVLQPTMTHFANYLQSHGYHHDKTILDHAMQEHNIHAASRIYKNIYLDELCQLLNTDSDQAEQITSHMMSEGRLMGSIDQIEHIIYFDSSKEICESDEIVRDICFQLNTIADSLSH